LRSTIEDILDTQYGLKLTANPVLIGAARGKAVWWVETRSGCYALKLRANGDGQAIEEEAEALRKASGYFAQVPHFRLPSGEGPPSLLIEWCEGQTLLSAYRSRPWQAWHYGYQFGHAQAELHTAPRSDFDGHETLLHLDLHPGNVIVRDGKIVAIIDWRNAREGDPRVDIARTWLLLRWSLASGARRIAWRLTDSHFCEGWWQGYVERAGMPEELAPFLNRACEDMGVGQTKRCRKRLARYAKELRGRVKPAILSRALRPIRRCLPAAARPRAAVPPSTI
jgi:aminoglycoside phosphotransferase (APT) family kinase protein